MEEARAGVGHLGVPRENVHFLGLPDGGLGEIWSRHEDPAKSYLSVLLASDHAPYEGLEVPNLPYARTAAVDAAKSFIARYKPDVIYTGHPDERHVDHRTNNWFVVRAMQELLREGVISSNVELRVDQVYGPGPQKAAPYRYEKHILNVTPEARARGQEADWFYQSQSGNRGQGKIRPLDQLPRQEVHWKILDWNEHAGWNE
jgi:LmbE family N-acetylglucosaminyl deacetylase